MKIHYQLFFSKIKFTHKPIEVLGGELVNCLVYLVRLASIINKAKLNVSYGGDT